MDSLQNLLAGLAVALSPQYVMFAFLGSFVGTLLGVLPGIGSAAGIAILIPLTVQLDATGAIIMLCAIFYGTQYGGTITSVLLNVPGETASAVTCLEGYQMAKRGRAGAALSVAALGSFFGGTVATLGLVIAAPPLARLALKFGPAESFALMVLGMSLVTGLAGKSMMKGLLAGVFGMLIAMIGMDPVRGTPRYNLGRMELLDGVGFIPVIMGLFGLAEILLNAEQVLKPVFHTGKMSLIPTREDVKDSVGPVLRGTVLGFVFGLVPGVTGAILSFMSYAMERKLSKHPERFGAGAIEGVAGPETTNNSHANAAFIPLFTLGIPASPSAAVLMGAFMINGLAPGPFLFKDHPEFVWAVIASMYVGNIFLLILNLPLIPLWVQVIRLPYGLLFPLIICFMAVGAYSIDNSAFDVILTAVFGVVGYVFRKLDIPLAPVVITLILGPLMERSLRTSLDLSQGDYSFIIQSPLAVAMLLLAAVVLLSPMLRFVVRGRGAASGEASGA